MLGLTLSLDQLREAPPAVRRWIRDELFMTIDSLSDGERTPVDNQDHLVPCTPVQAQQILDRIARDHVLAQLFMTLGRSDMGTPMGDFMVLRADDLAARLHLADLPHLFAGIDAINTVARAVIGDGHAVLVGVHGGGYCVLRKEAFAAIGTVWRDIVNAQAAPAKPAEGQPPREMALPTYRFNLGPEPAGA